MRSKRLTWLAVILSLTAWSAWAADKPKRARRVIRLGETRVEGRIHKPQAFYILQRSKLRFNDRTTAPDVTKKLYDSIEREPF